jgi:predicted dehydrogenase
MRDRFGTPRDVTMARYLINAGPLARDSWYRNEELEGSRFVGEGGHFIDTLSWWIGSDPTEVTAMVAGEEQELLATLRYADGSLASLAYVTRGNPRFPKETFEASSGGCSARLDNFRRAIVWAGKRRRSSRALSADKGQRAQLDSFLQSVRTGAAMPIPLSSLVQTTRATFAVAASAARGSSIRVV